MVLDRLRAALDTAADIIVAARSWGLALAAAETVARRDVVDEAVARALRFLEHAQCADGSFRDFNLLPGASKGWITAHVAFVLEDVPAAQDIRTRAASYLASRGSIDGGWAYNDRVGVDCDSTAQAILVLQRANLNVSAFIVEWLMSCQLEDGSFPTYRADAAGRRGWSAGHGDVTLIVCEALRRMSVHGDAIDRANAWLDRMSVDGVVPAYWWSDDAYSLWAQERAGFATDVSRTIARARLKDASLTFSSMLLVAAASTVDRGELAAPVCRLLATQLEDGSWPCDPCLRVTDPAVNVGARDAAGAVYAGRRRVFSTAHATAALAAVSHSYRLGGTHAAHDRDHFPFGRCRVWLDAGNNIIWRTAQRQLPESADRIEGNEVRRGRLYVGGGMRSDVLQLQRRLEILSRSGVPQRYVCGRGGDVR